MLTEAPILWPPYAKSWLTGKDPSAGKDWGQEEKGTTENKMVGWHHRLNGHEFEQTPGDDEGQGSLACCCSGDLRHDWETELNLHVCMCAQLLQSCLTLWDAVDFSLSPWNSPGRNTGVGCHALLQRIFLTQGSNLHLLCLHWITGEAHILNLPYIKTIKVVYKP